MKEYRCTINGQEYKISRPTLEALDRYVQHGICPGSFLQAALSNNLVESIGQADLENFRNLPAVANYLYNELPSTCWGSSYKMEQWIKQGGLNGTRNAKIESSNPE